MKNILKQYLPLCLVFCVVTAVLFWGIRLKSQSFYFQDETEHVTLGWMLTNFNKVLYKDISSNHQPIPILIGAALSKYIQYGSLFELIERIRLVAFAVTTIAGVVLVWRYKWSGLLAYASTYALGYYYFAWYILAESIVIPAVLYIFLFFATRFISAEKNKPYWLDPYFLGVSLFLIVFSLLPLWPFCFLTVLAAFFLVTRKQFYTLLSSILIPTLILFFMVNPVLWYHETIFNNLHYFIPFDDKLSFLDALKLLFFPFVFIGSSTHIIGRYFALAALFCIASCILWLWKNKKALTRTQVLSLVFLYMLLISLNTRVRSFPMFFYSGFHFYPFVAGFFSLFACFFSLSLGRLKKPQLQATLWLVPALIFIGCIPWVFEDTNKLNEYYIQYGGQDSLGRLITQLKQPNDTFFSEPNGHGYINMISGVPIAGRQLFHLQWAYRSPELRDQFHQLLAENPPTFIYLTQDTGDYYRELQPVLKSEYAEVFHDKNQIFFYILKKRAGNLSDNQKKYMQEEQFNFAEE